MNSILEFEDKTIGYKNDLIDYLEKECKRLREDNGIDIETLESYLKDYIRLIYELKRKDSMNVYAICIGAMGDLNIYDVNIEIKY